MTKKSKKQGKKIENDNNNNKVSGSKRVRFSEEEFEFDHEESLERAKRRRGAVKLEGYESDETDASENEEEEEEDMFAEGDGTTDISKLTKKSEEEAYNVAGNKKNLRYLNSEEIIGQDFLSKE